MGIYLLSQNLARYQSVDSSYLGGVCCMYGSDPVDK